MNLSTVGPTTPQAGHPAFPKLILSGSEHLLDEHELIVSKTNLKGHISYANSVFLDIAGLTASESIGKPHNLIRNDAMPRCVYKLLWETIQSGREIFAYVVNRTKAGDYYWVFAHVTPSYDDDHSIVGYHSNRRRPRPEAVAAISGIYALLLEAEASVKSSKEGLKASYALLQQLVAANGGDYERFVLSL